jgi:hypothetical protein
MLQWAEDSHRAKPESGPRTFWEAVTTISRVRDQYELASRRRDLGRLKRLRGEQAVAWSYVRDFAGTLEKRGQAPAGMVDRLREVLKIHAHDEKCLDEACQRLRTKAREAQDEAQAELESLPLAA